MLQSLLATGKPQTNASDEQGRPEEARPTLQILCPAAEHRVDHERGNGQPTPQELGQQLQQADRHAVGRARLQAHPQKRNQQRVRLGLDELGGQQEQNFARETQLRVPPRQTSAKLFQQCKLQSGAHE